MNLAILRGIGWRQWDPIGLGTIEGAWADGSADDAYDGYLLQAAARLQNGLRDCEVADYLVDIETVHLGLSSKPRTKLRAVATVTAIRRYVETLT